MLFFRSSFLSLVLRRSLSCTATMNKAENRLVWVDCEMTGLDPDKDKLLEVAVIVTEGDLRAVAEGPSVVIHQPDSVLDSMGEWCTKHHSKSGLTKAVRESKISTAECEQQILNFLQDLVPKGKCPLAGNSVGQDARFLRREMPRLMDHLHYRIVDVSTVKEITKRWYPEEAAQVPKKALGHRALDDIRESIKELEFYRKKVFK